MVLCDNLEGWDGWEVVGGVVIQVAGGTYVHLSLIHADVDQKPIQYCKAIMRQLKIHIYFFYPSAPAPNILYPALNLDWWFISYIILYMFQCHSPKSSHLLPLLQSPKDCSIHLCPFCCVILKMGVSLQKNKNKIFRLWKIQKKNK